MKILTAFFIIITCLLFTLSTYQWVTPINNNINDYKENEIYDKTLNKLNNKEKLLSFIDSIAVTKHIMKRNGLILHNAQYVLLIDEIIKKRFYHGYSHFNMANNYVAYLFGEYIWKDLSTTVITNDILLYNHAACSQQAIVFQDLLKEKKYNVRKVAFEYSHFGHFCNEVYYDNKCHFFDPNLEANWGQLTAIPSAKELFADKELVQKIYSHKSNKDLFLLFEKSKPSYGKWNNYPAKKLRAFHYVTKVLSHIGFIITGLIAFFLFKIKKRNSITINCTPS